MEHRTLQAAADYTQRWRGLEAQLKEAKAERDAAIRAAADDGWTQTDIVKATDLTRETIRRITNPAAAEAVRRAQRRTKKQESQ